MSMMVVKVLTRRALGLLALIFGSLGSAHAGATVVAPVRYACADKAELVITRSAESATVVFRARTYTLGRSRSSIGEKYLSDAAALIVDGPSAVFISEDRHGAGACVAASSSGTR